jgi:hypothetical protein
MDPIRSRRCRQPDVGSLGPPITANFRATNVSDRCVTAAVVRSLEEQRQTARTELAWPSMAVSAPMVMPAGRLERMNWGYEGPTLRGLSHCFAIRTDDREVGTRFSSLFGALEQPGDPGAWYSLLKWGSPGGEGWALYYAADRFALPPDPPGAVSWLLHHANRSAIQSCTGEVVVHAAAAEHDGRALLFPGPPGSGKSTLVAALVRAGLGYLTDEAAAVDFDSLEVRPYPKPISVKPGSQCVLRDLEPPPWPGATRAGGDWWVPPAAIRSDCVAGPAPPSFVIALRYLPGAPTSLVAMRPAQAVMALAENSFNLPGQGRAGLALLARVVERSVCFRLVFGDLLVACRLVLQLVDGTEPHSPDARSAPGPPGAR